MWGEVLFHWTSLFWKEEWGQRFEVGWMRKTEGWADRHAPDWMGLWVSGCCPSQLGGPWLAGEGLEPAGSRIGESPGLCATTGSCPNSISVTFPFRSRGLTACPLQGLWDRLKGDDSLSKSQEGHHLYIVWFPWRSKSGLDGTWTVIFFRWIADDRSSWVKKAWRGSIQVVPRDSEFLKGQGCGGFGWAGQRARGRFLAGVMLFTNAKERQTLFIFFLKIM